MQIDWITVVAQVVNFLILVYLLRRFLYQPVMRAMQAREQLIAERLQQSEQREQQALAQGRSLQAQQETFDRESAQRLMDAQQAAQAHHQSLLETARREVEARRTRWLQELSQTQQLHLQRIQPLAAAALTRAARQLLTELADADLEQQALRSFFRQLDALDHGALELLRKSARRAGRLRVSCAFEPDADTRARIRRALQHHLFEAQEPEIEIEFRRVPALVCGIELDVEGRKVGWTLDTLLQGLHDELVRALAHGIPETAHD